MQAQATTTVAAPANMPSIIARKDLLQHRILFLADTFNREANTIQYWDGKRGSKPNEASVDYYKSTKPIDNEDEVKALVQGFSKEFGAKEVILRQRLIKESVVKNTEGKANAVDLEDYKAKLIAAITKAINETM